MNSNLYYTNSVTNPWYYTPENFESITRQNRNHLLFDPPTGRNIGETSINAFRPIPREQFRETRADRRLIFEGTFPVPLITQGTNQFQLLEQHEKLIINWTTTVIHSIFSLRNIFRSRILLSVEAIANRGLLRRSTRRTIAGGGGDGVHMFLGSVILNPEEIQAKLPFFLIQLVSSFSLSTSAVAFLNEDYREFIVLQYPFKSLIRITLVQKPMVRYFGDPLWNLILDKVEEKFILKYCEEETNNNKRSGYCFHECIVATFPDLHDIVYSTLQDWPSQEQIVMFCEAHHIGLMVYKAFDLSLDFAHRTLGDTTKKRGILWLMSHHNHFYRLKERCFTWDQEKKKKKWFWTSELMKKESRLKSKEQLVQQELLDNREFKVTTLLDELDEASRVAQKRLKGSILFFDVETFGVIKESESIYLIGCLPEEEEEMTYFETMDEYWSWLIRYSEKHSQQHIYIIAHNGSGFDFIFVREYLVTKDIQHECLEFKNQIVSMELRIGTVKVSFRDSYLIFRQGLQELSFITCAETKIEFPHHYLHELSSKEEFIKRYTEPQNGYDLGPEYDPDKVYDLKEWSIQYLQKDLYLLKQVYEHYETFFYEKYGIFLPSIVSLRHLTMKLFKTKFYKNPSLTLMKIQNAATFSFIRESNMGAPSGPIEQCYLEGGNIFKIDVNSLYPFAAMSHPEYPWYIGFPNASDYIRMEVDDLKQHIDRYPYGFSRVEFDQSHLNIPFLLARNFSGQLYYVCKGEGIYPHNILRYAQNELGIRFSSCSESYITLAGYYKESPLDDFIKEMFEWKKNARINKQVTELLVAKLLLNGLIGAFNMKTEETKVVYTKALHYIFEYLTCSDVKLNSFQVFDTLQGEEVMKLNLDQTDRASHVKKDVFPAFTSYVLGYSKIWMYELLRKLKEQNAVIAYSDTDSFIFQCTSYAFLPNSFIGEDIGQVKIEESHIRSFISIGSKRYSYIAADQTEKTVCAGVQMNLNKDVPFFNNFMNMMNTSMLSTFIKQFNFEKTLGLQITQVMKEKDIQVQLHHCLHEPKKPWKCRPLDQLPDNNEQERKLQELTSLLTDWLLHRDEIDHPLLSELQNKQETAQVVYNLQK